jgi:4-amino-4-deoxy-L-arabinose transferase-like glycosyltransferase
VSPSVTSANVDVEESSPKSTVSARTFTIAFVALVAAGFLLRLAYVWFARRDSCGAAILVDGCPGDSWVYHTSANLLADGKGWIGTSDYVLSHGRIRVPAADHPPGLIVVLAAFSWVGLSSWLAHQLVMVLIGTASIVVGGLATREVFGPRTALIVAAVIAFDPNVWIHDGNVLSESPSILLMFGAIWAAYRLWYRPSWGRAVVLGAVIGALMLVRPETGLLVVLLAAPMALLRRDGSLLRRFERLGVVIVAAVVVIVPWVGYNLSRFNHPVFLSNTGTSVANTNCDITYYGPLVGYWSPACIPQFTRAPGEDQSDDDIFLRRVGLDYIRAHERRFPVVVAARIARMWGVFRPAQQIRLEYYEGRPRWAGWLALGTLYATVLVAVYGGVVTRRRRIPLTPLLAPIILVIITAMSTFGVSRYRAPAEPALCILIAVGIDALLVRLWPRRFVPERSPSP